ncbi:MAG: cytochrome c3 family protein [Planctomycetota bacterium]|jgi:hypothetical protein
MERTRTVFTSMLTKGRGAWRALTRGGLRLGRIPDQVIRLAILVAVSVIALIVVRQRFVPPTFGEEGHYRSAARDAIAALPVRFAGWQACVECHDEEGDKKRKSYHRTLSCEVCHGPAQDHAKEAEEGEFDRRPIIPSTRTACLTCHEYLPSRPTGFPQILELQHNPMKPCMECHDAHDPTPPEAVGSCAACHGHIARTKAVSHHAALDCETCHEALPEHAQRPRAFLPKKPTERKFCGGCHGKGAKPPKETAKRIPRVELGSHGGSYLCWQCHYPHFPEAR